MAANNWPDVTATIFYGARLTYRQLKQEAIRLATALEDLGVRKGDRVGMMLPNSPQFVIAYYAVIHLGATVVTVNPLYVERELEYIVGDSGMRLLIALDTAAPRVLAVRQKTDLHQVIFTGIQDYLPEPARQPYVERMRAKGTLPEIPAEPTLHSWPEVMARVKEPHLIRPTIDPEEDVAALLYTGGTTGIPKGVMLTHKNLFANALQCYSWSKEFARPGEETFLCVIPFFHSFGMTVCMNVAITRGATMILLPRFEIEEVLEAIKTYQPTFFPGVPTMYIAILNHPKVEEYGVSAIRLWNSGSAPLPVEVMSRFQGMTDGLFIEGYGLTEASPVTHTNPVLGLQKIGSVGIPVPDTDARIVDVETGEKELPVGEIGELIIRGPQVMKGYWNRPEETAQALRMAPDGTGPWLYTGDIARMDEDGFFYIVDRKKDVIICSGFNVYPREVEEVLYAHPKVLEAAVIGVPDPYRGETAKAFVVLKPGEEATEEEIITYCKEQMAAYKAPTIVEFRDSLPKTAIGKVLKEQEKASALPTVEVPEDVTPSAFFHDLLPRLFDLRVEAQPPEGLDGTEFRVQYRISGEPGGVFGLRVRDGRRLEVVDGEIESPNVALEMSHEDWWDAVTGRVFTGDPPVVAINTRSRYDALMGLKGTVTLELTRPEGGVFRAMACYNGADTPRVTILMTTDDYTAMQRGELDGQTAFTSGKLRFEGDVGLLMALAQLSR